MEIKPRKRPWEKQHRQGNRYNPDPFYQSAIWKQTRKAFINSTTTIDGKEVSNAICIECYKLGHTEPVHTVDHIHRIKAGGDRTDHSNLQSLCKHHHAIKSANEANE